MLERLTRWIARYPKSVIAIVILLTGFFSFGLTKTEMATDHRSMLPEGDPIVAAFNEVDETFGGADFVMVILDMDEVFTTEALRAINRLTNDLDRVRGVSSVLSITNIEEIKGVEGGIEVVKLIEEIPTSESELQELKSRVLSNDDYAGQIISTNGEMALILVQLLPEADNESVIRDVKEVVRNLGLDETVYLTGEPIMGQEIGQIAGGAMAKLLPIAILVMITILYLSFRNVRGVILPLFIAVVTIIWTVGLMGYFRVPLSAISIIMPIIMISVGIADGIHILTRYREELSLGLDKQKALTMSVVAVGLACFLTSITTMGGFGSLYTSSLRIIRNFGLFTAIGVGIAFIITVTFFLAFLSLLPSDRRAQNKERNAFLQKILWKWANYILSRAKTILVAAGLLVLLGSVGILFISTETDFMSFFNADSSIRLAFNAMKENFGGVDIIQVAVKGDIRDPKVLQAMERFQDDIGEIEEVGKPTSVVNILRSVNKALHEGKPELKILPKTKQEVAQYLLLLSMGGASALDSLISFSYDQALIQARVSTQKSSERDEVIGAVEKAMGRHFGSDIEVVLTGSPVLESRMVPLMARGQLQSLALAILFVLVLMVVISKSLTYGVFCTIPVSLTVALNFGIMGWFKVPLDVASATIASIAIGIGIDYAIHLFQRYKEELVTGKSVEEAIRITISKTGQAIFYNAAAVGLGFFVLTFSSMPALARMGWLIALTMFFSSTASMTVLPALLLVHARWRGRRVVRS